MDFLFHKKTLNCCGKLVDISVPKVMGILNLTPDSFFDGGKYLSETEILKQVSKMISQGATFIDIGAMSSRPGAEFVSQNEELSRLEMALKIIRKEFSEILISIDTFRSEIARICVENFGAALINDISAGQWDAKMFETVANLQVPYVAMHIKGTPSTMQQNVDYQDFIKEIILYFAEIIEKSKLFGINDLILDVGFGFAKTLEQNYILLKNLDRFQYLGFPLLVGVSRKSMIYKLLGVSPSESLNGTTAINLLSLLRGAKILRVHDVKEAVETIKIFEKYQQIE